MTTSLTNSDQSAESLWALLPWKTRIMLAILSKLTDATRRSNGTVNRRLLSFFDFRSAATPSAPFKGVTTSDVTVDPSRDLWYRLYVPSTTTTSSLPVVVFFHGGGFSFLSPDCFAYDAVCRRFARKIPAVVVSVNYRLSPEHRCPCQYDDGFDVLKFLDRNTDAAALPATADLSKIFLAGDSAGANVAHQVALRACRERDQFSKAKAVGLISIQPFFGGEERTESEIRLQGAPLVSVTRTDWLWKAFLPVGSTRDHEVSNVSGPNAAKDISELEYPATVVVVGGLDPLQDWQRRYYEWLRKSGKEAKLIEYPKMVHAFYIFPELPESNQLISQVKDFVASLL